MDRVTDKVIVTAVHNPFDPLASRETRLLDPRKTVAEYVEVFFPNAVREGYELAISINGAVANTEEVLPLRVEEGLSLAFCLVPRGGGGGKNIVRIVAMIALTALAIYTGGATSGLLGLTEGSFASGMVTGIVAGAIVVAGGMVINAILPYQTPSMEAISGSPTYGWDQGTNYLLEGAALPILYGKRRVTPPVIARHIEAVAGENNQYLSILMALCEGALQTVPSNDSDALRDNLRINRVAASKYTGITAEIRRGVNTEALGQALIQDFNATYTDTAVGIKLTDNVNWITRTTQGNAVETLGVNFSCPAGLGAANSNGGLDTVNLRIQVEFKKQGDSVWTRWQDYNQAPFSVTTGRWSAGCWQYDEAGTQSWFELLAGTASGHYEGEPYVPTIAADEYAPVYFWHWVESMSIQQVGTVLVDHLQFIGATTSALRKGWKIAVPAGTYDLRVRLEDAYQTSAGISADCYWDFYTEAVPDDFIYPNTALLAIRALATNQLSGGFPTIDIEIDRGDIYIEGLWGGASSNPAIACADLLTNPRYGAGIDVGRIDSAAFSAWATFCAANSYTCNLYLDQTISVRQALNMISQLGRATVIQLGSKFTVIVDKVEGTPVQRFLFNVGNIAQDSFKEQWLSQDDRANAIEIEYYDADLDYERTALTLYASDFDTTDLETKQASLVLYGCTNRAMAIKHGKFLLNCNRYLTLTAQWDCDIDALACFPGDIVEVQHDIPQWGVGGRVVSATASSITLDRPVTIVAGTYHVRVKHQDDDTFEEKTVTNGAGTYTTLNISGTWTKIPAQYALYSFGLINFVVKLFRVLRISRANDLRRKITAIEYYEPIYTDDATVPAPPPWPDPVWVSNLKAMEIYREGSTAGVALSWTGYATPFRIFVKRADETTYRSIGEAYGNSFESWGYDVGVAYIFLVTPGSNPNAGDGATVTITLEGHGGLPTIATPVFDDARCTYTDKIQLEWLAIIDPLLGYFELRTDLNWGTETGMLYQGKGTTYTMKPTGASYTFYIKSHDTFSNYSAGYDSITLTMTVAAPIFVSINGASFGRVRIEWEPMNDESYDVVEVWRSTSNNSGGASLLGTVHGTVFVDAQVTVDTTYYYWLRTKSIFATYSAFDVGVTSGHSVNTATINTGDLANAIITSMKLAPNIVTPEIVDVLPTLPDSMYPVGKLVFYTVDMKLYRNRPYGYEAGSYTPPSSGGGSSSMWSDNFDRADGGLGSNWMNWGDLPPMKIISNYAAGSSAGDTGATWAANTPAADQFCQFWASSINNVSLGVRVQPTSIMAGYIFDISSGASGGRYRMFVQSTNGTAVAVASVAGTFASGDVFYTAVSGTNMVGMKNGTVVATANVTMYSAGLTGIYAYGDVTRIDSFYAGNL
jgi:predicted phage tail protein